MRLLLLGLLTFGSIHTFANASELEPVKYTGTDDSGESCAIEIVAHPAISGAVYVYAHFDAEISLGVHDLSTLLGAPGSYKCGYERKIRENTISWRADPTSEMPSFQQVDFNYLDANRAQLESVSVKSAGGFSSTGACVRLRLAKRVTCGELKISRLL